jgi:iron(III) transport system ATP-binding protein
MNMHGLQVDGIAVGYPGARGLRVVVRDLSLALVAGEIGCLLGASGCGKTTVLRAIAGFEPVLAGSIALEGTRLSSPGSSVAPERRGIGLMFQDYALFPHLDVARNVGFGLGRLDRAARTARVAELLALVGLPDAGSAYPHELSGGQQQRVALARALAPAPGLVLLDEPFSNLDVDTRARLAAEVRGILKAAGATALLVTHDQAEAFAMADRIGVMDEGRLLQWADAPTLYRQPADRVVAGFVGRGGVVPAAALGLAGGDVLVRPHQLRLDEDGPIAATVVACSFLGPDYVAQVRLGDGSLVEADLPATAVPAIGDAVRLALVDAPTPVPGRAPVDA